MKKILCVIVLIIIFIATIITVINKKNNNNTNFIKSENDSELSIEYNEENSMYSVYDENGDLIIETPDEGLADTYIDYPNYSPGF